MDLLRIWMGLHQIKSHILRGLKFKSVSFGADMLADFTGVAWESDWLHEDSMIGILPR